MNKKLYVSQLEDLYVKKNFQTIGEIFNNTPFLKGEWAFMTIPVNGTNASLKIPHNQKFTPLDAILLSVVGGSVTFNYTEFDATFISLNAIVTSSPMTIRIFIGRYSEDTISV